MSAVSWSLSDMNYRTHRSIIAWPDGSLKESESGLLIHLHNEIGWVEACIALFRIPISSGCPASNRDKTLIFSAATFFSRSWWFAHRIDRKSKEMDSVSFHASSKVSEIQTPSARRRSAIERTQQNPKSNRIRSIHRHPKMKWTTRWSTLWLVCLSFLFFLFSFLASSEIVHHRLCKTAVRERKLYYYSTDRLSSFINQRLR